jgi:hypothetical protein
LLSWTFESLPSNLFTICTPIGGITPALSCTDCVCTTSSRADKKFHDTLRFSSNYLHSFSLQSNGSKSVCWWVVRPILLLIYGSSCARDYGIVSDIFFL